jgi:hypothetical protein
MNPRPASRSPLVLAYCRRVLNGLVTLDTIRIIEGKA